jgi:hypothetical protein
MTFRTSGRGRGDSAFGFSGFRVTRISGTLDSRRHASPRPGVKLCTWCRVQNWSSQGRPTWIIAHTRAVKAGRRQRGPVDSIVLRRNSLKQDRLFRNPRSRPRVSITQSWARGADSVHPALRRSSRLKAGRPVSCRGSFGPNRDHRCCQERAIRRAAAKGGQGDVRRLQTAEAALKDQRQFKRLLDARRRRDRLEPLVVGAQKSSGNLHDPAQTS